MTSQEKTLEEICERLVKLEKQNRRLKRAGAAALIVAASLALLGQAPTKKTVEANEFILRDGAGKLRARLAMYEKLGTPQLMLFDDKGNESVGVTAGFEGEKIKPLEGSKAPERYGGAIDIFDGQGRERETLTADDQEGGKLYLCDSEERHFAALAGDSISVSDKEDKQGAELRPGAIMVKEGHQGAAALGSGAVVVTDADGFEATLGVSDLVTPRTGETHKTSAASLVLFDKDKHVIWRAP
jgi:hypothetical protein